LVFINAHSGEEYITVEGQSADRDNLDPWHNGNTLVSSVASTGIPTIVVIHSVGPIILEKILALKNVIAIVWAGLPGQESGNALVDILYGDISPSGHLPFTIAKQESDYGIAVAKGGIDNFKEGLYIDYRNFDKAGITPRYEFGFGLCKFPPPLPSLILSPLTTQPAYTTFTTTPLSIKKAKPECPTPPHLLPHSKQTQSTLHSLLPHMITTTITNTGSTPGAEVLQLYLSLSHPGVDFPPWQLRGFKKVFLKPGESKSVEFRLRRKDVSYWDVVGQVWKEVSGEIGVRVGNSSRAEGRTGRLVLDD
jgi:beta-glucosidase